MNIRTVMRQNRISMIQDLVELHLERADDLERHANHWWRASKYAWLHAAFIHRESARELKFILESIHRGIYDTGIEDA